MGQEVGENVKQLKSDEFDELMEQWDEDLIRQEIDAILEQEEDASIDGVSRVEELENVIDDILDLWDRNLLVANATEGTTEEVFDVMESAAVILNQPELDGE